MLDGNDVSSLEAEVTDLAARRPDVLRRLLERGVHVDTLEMLLPGWRPFLDAALRELAVG